MTLTRGFGSRPGQSWWKRSIGWPNLIKRLQAPEIMDAMAPSNGVRILDIGCGGGHFSIELARAGASVVAMDIDFQNVRRLSPTSYAMGASLAGLVADARRLPFKSGCFDRVLISDLLPYVLPLDAFFLEVARVLRPGGCFVLSNGLGHPAVERLYRGRLGRWLAQLFSKRMPPDYAEYAAVLNRSFGTPLRAFLQEEEMVKALEGAGLSVRQCSHNPSAATSTLISYIMLACQLAGWPTFGRHLFLLYPPLWILNRVDPDRAGFGVLLRAQRAE